MNNIIKYIFGILVIVLIIATAYFTYKSSNEKSLREQNKNKKEEKQSVLQNDLRLAVAELDTMNPIISKNRNVYEYSKLIYSSLVTIDAGYRVKNDLAKEINKVDDLTYKIKIRNDAKWVNTNELVTTEDVKFTIEQINGLDSIYKDNIENISEVSIENDTVILKLKQSIPFFEYNLTFPIMKKVEGEIFKNSEQYQVPISSGKYKLKEIVNNVYTFIKNDEYYEQFNPNITMISIIKYDTMGEVYNSFKSGNLDLITTNEPNTAQYLGTGGYSELVIKGRDFNLLAFNNERITESNLRHAIAKMINYDELVSTIGGLNQKSLYPLDYGSYLYKNLNEGLTGTSSVKYNPEEGNAIFERLGYKREGASNTYKKDGQELRINILVNDGNLEQKKMAEYIKDILLKNGIFVKIEFVSSKIYYDRIQNKNYDMSIIGIRESYRPVLDRYLGNGNLLNYINQNVKDYLENVKKDNIDKNREKILEDSYKEVEKIYLQDLPFIGLMRNGKKMLLNFSVTTDGEINMFNIFQNIERWYRK